MGHENTTACIHIFKLPKIMNGQTELETIWLAWYDHKYAFTLYDFQITGNIYTNYTSLPKCCDGKLFSKHLLHSSKNNAFIHSPGIKQNLKILTFINETCSHTYVQRFKTKEEALNNLLGHEESSHTHLLKK